MGNGVPDRLRTPPAKMFRHKMSPERDNNVLERSDDVRAFAGPLLTTASRQKQESRQSVSERLSHVLAT